MPDTDRSSVITIGGKEYRLVLSTRATKEIGKRYGGLESLGDKLLKGESFDMAMDEITWLITMLANQSILAHNLLNPDEKQDLLTEEMVDVLTTPMDIAGFKDAIMEAMMQGTARHVASEDGGEGNTAGG
jgi:hypothetical protein